MLVPMRIYYDVTDGSVIQTTGGFEDKWLERYETIDEQIPKYSSLTHRNRDSFNVLELEYGQYAQDFAECNGYRVNPQTKEMEFSYPDPSEPDQPPVYQEPLSKQVERLKQEDLNNKEAIAELYMLSMGGF